MEDGGHVVEDLELVEARVNAQREKLWKKNRHTTRRVNIGIFSLQDCHNADHSLQRYHCQLQVVEFMIQATEDDHHIWQWLEQLL